MTIPSGDRASTPGVLHHPQRDEPPGAAEPRAAVHRDGAAGAASHTSRKRVTTSSGGTVQSWNCRNFLVSAKTEPIDLSQPLVTYSWYFLKKFSAT